MICLGQSLSWVQNSGPSCQTRTGTILELSFWISLRALGCRCFWLHLCYTTCDAKFLVLFVFLIFPRSFWGRIRGCDWSTWHPSIWFVHVQDGWNGFLRNDTFSHVYVYIIVYSALCVHIWPRLQQYSPIYHPRSIGTMKPAGFNLTVHKCNR